MYRIMSGSGVNELQSIEPVPSTPSNNSVVGPDVVFSDDEEFSDEDGMDEVCGLMYGNDDMEDMAELYSRIVGTMLPKKKKKHSPTCWICKSPEFKATQTEDIRAHHDALELFHRMKDNLKNLTEADDLTCYRKWWMSTAMEHNHTALVDILSYNPQSMIHNERGFETLSVESLEEVRDEGLEETQDFIHFGGVARRQSHRPLYNAIKEGHRSLVEMFLHAGAFVTDRYADNGYFFQRRKKTYDPICAYDAARSDHIDEDVSAVEYACIVNQPEMLKLIVAHFNSQHPPRESAELITRPLHLVMKCAAQFYGPHVTLLPSLVQLIIDAGEGGDVDCKDECGYTPLETLINNIRIISPLGEVGAEQRRVIIEIAKILLNSSLNSVNSLYFVALLAKVKIPWYEILRLQANKDTRDLPVADHIHDYLQLVTDVARVLALRGTDPMRSWFHKRIPQTAAHIIDMFRNENTFVCNKILDCLSELYRVVLFAGGSRLTDEHWHYFLGETSFTDLFMLMAEYSSLSGRTVRLRNMILSALGTSSLNKLMNRLVAARGRNLRNIFHRRLEFHTYTPANPAIRYVSSVGKMRSLQDLARQTITRAVKVEALLSDTSLNIGLPPKFEALVRLL